jgi:hypothetical protein
MHQTIEKRNGPGRTATRISKKKEIIIGMAANVLGLLPLGAFILMKVNGSL